MTRNDCGRAPDLVLELALHNDGIAIIAGIDEAGRGAWAGPVVAAAVVLPLERSDLKSELDGVRDSKLLNARQRSHWAGIILEIASAISIGQATAEEVDTLGLIPATRSAMTRAIHELDPSPDHLLIDHILLPESELPQTALPRGDAIVLSIAAASIIAKVTRDNIMIGLEERYPGYGFSRHKGYGTRVHREALAALGPSPVHRRSFTPIAALLSKTMAPTT
ncbi:MAG: ribonuclease HII [Anaerolineales bacterium]|nr:ribonuclease HII [Anaerolineales bacterium]